MNPYDAQRELIRIIEDTTLSFKENPKLTLDANLAYIDFMLVKVVVDRNKAGVYRERLVELLRTQAQPEFYRIEPSYLLVEELLNENARPEVKDKVPPQDGDATLRIKSVKLKASDLALRLFALGYTLGLWELTTPQDLGFKGKQAEDLVQQGMVLIHAPDPTLLS